MQPQHPKKPTLQLIVNQSTPLESAADRVLREALKRLEQCGTGTAPGLNKAALIKHFYQG
jgi:hypothetical protein